jgi:hypothetical protein
MSAHAPGEDTAKAATPAVAEFDGKAWYPPLPLWKLFLLLILTLGFYSLFFLYRAAKDLRDHGNPKITPWLYPFSTLIWIATAFAAHKLATAAEDRVGFERSSSWGSPALITLLASAGQIAMAASGISNLTLWYLAAVFLYSTPWLLLQRQLNLIKQDQPPDAFVTPPWRYTRLQWAALGVGALVCVVIGFAVRQDLVRLSGEKLVAGETYADPRDRFEFVIPAAGWTIVGPGYLGEDSDLELLGPGDSDWAIVFVHDQTGWRIDDLVEFRFSLLNEELPGYREVRRFIDGTEIAASYAGYYGMSPIDGRSEYSVTSFVTDNTAVEFIVYTAGSSNRIERGRRLAESIRPVMPEEHVR